MIIVKIKVAVKLVLTCIIKLLYYHYCNYFQVQMSHNYITQDGMWDKLSYNEVSVWLTCLGEACCCDADVWELRHASASITRCCQHMPHLSC